MSRAHDYEYRDDSTPRGEKREVRSSNGQCVEDAGGEEKREEVEKLRG